MRDRKNRSGAGEGQGHFSTACAVRAQSHPTLCAPMDCSPPDSSFHRDSPGKNTGVGCHALLHGIFPTQGSNPGLPHCRQILYCLSRQGSPRRLEWVAYPFSRGSSQPRSQTGVSCIVGRFFISGATREALSTGWAPAIVCSADTEGRTCHASCFTTGHIKTSP